MVVDKLRTGIKKGESFNQKSYNSYMAEYKKGLIKAFRKDKGESYTYATSEAVHRKYEEAAYHKALPELLRIAKANNIKEKIKKTWVEEITRIETALVEVAEL